MSWGSTTFGRIFTGSSRWNASIAKDHLIVEIEGHRSIKIPIKSFLGVRVERGLIWSTCHFDFMEETNKSVKVDGIPNADAAVLGRTLQDKIDAYHGKKFTTSLEAWKVAFLFNCPLDEWTPKSVAAHYCQKKKPPSWPGKSWWQVGGAASPEATLQQIVDEKNAAHLKSRLKSFKAFFDTVEKNPLTDEQRHACICMDDSVLIVAAAGSGKTSTMVAKTGYALKAGLARPDQILLLAFNRDTANELGERVAEQLRDVPEIEKVRSQTFHGFGLEVIGKATGKKPSLAPWLEAGQDIKEMTDIIESLAKDDKDFLRDWDIFRTVYALDVGAANSHSEPEILRDGKRGFETAKGDVVKSKQERHIANWLFYHGINYRYEARYEHDTADESHRQYFPDFYYPDIGLYHEHFAIDADGRPPAHFPGYLDGMKWKRALHAEKGTELFETKSFEIYTGEALRNLDAELRRRGLTPTFVPGREAIGLKPVMPKEIAKPFRVFQQHVKNNGLSMADLQSALIEQSMAGNAPRLKLFLALYEKVSREWERRLHEGGFIDFEDMLIQAADLVEKGRFDSPFVIILADEFQDSSRARVRLLKALANCRETPAHLCVVGDDWQGINRFAGSDISVMTEFEKVFDYSTILTLSTTFRCPKDICEVSSNFIQANPVQIKKSIATTNTLTKAPMNAYGFSSEDGAPGFLESQLDDMAGYVRTGKLRPLKGSHVSVMLLGRYHSDKPALLQSWISRFGDALKIEFRTAHGSKGLEAEYVYLLNVTEGRKGFPSQFEDDPALQLAMPAPDPYPFAEERRLFYVAMTRARKQVRFLTENGNPSQFLVELMKSGVLTIECVEGQTGEPCPKCGRGVLILRSGQFGEFQSCSRMVQCDYKKNIKSGQRGSGASRKPRITVSEGQACPTCKQGTMEAKSGQFGRFLGCSRYPKCRTTATLQ